MRGSRGPSRFQPFVCVKERSGTATPVSQDEVARLQDSAFGAGDRGLPNSLLIKELGRPRWSRESLLRFSEPDYTGRLDPLKNFR